MSNKGFTYTLKLDAEISDLTAKTAQVKKSMQSIMDAGKAPGVEKVFTSIEKALDKMREKASQPITSIAAFESFQKDANAAGTALNKLNSIIEDLGKMSAAEKMELLPPDLKQKITEANAALGTFTKAQAQAAEKSQDLIDAEKQLATAQKELSKAEGKVSDKKALISAQQQMVDKANAEANAIKAKIDALKKYQSTAAAYDAAGGNKSAKGGSKANAGKGLDGLNLPADRAAAQAAVPGLDLKNIQAVETELTRLNDQYREASKTVTDAEATQRRYGQQLTAAQNAATVASSKITTLSGTVSRLNNEFEKNKAQDTQAAYAQLRTEAGKLGVDLSNIPVDYTEQNFNELNAAMGQLAINGINQVDAGLNTMQTEMDETSTAAQNLASGVGIAKEGVTELDAKVADARAFTSRIQQFVGLQGGIQVARRAMRNAFTTIKELDQAMTEMAVVTDLEVGDYWDQLPRHTEDANKLGVAIKDVYKAETLYYQQGLKQNEVVAMSTQTLKMARIAGLSAEDATNKMTAALRGFNMELNETSAQRVADVYSQLAAITASDVDEISSAMTKTASIAASAGMEFETTAAFLSQIIETTRESAETAGTALKTVIARFQELKKDPSEIGEVDGEVVDANKIETALRSVGVSLRDTQGQFRELDDVFLELAGKWDSLDTNTQRYIATIAAGSRQQSRFIAMMSDYSRTQELVSAANNSTGASNKQFEKTMDSLEAKLNELKNAWDSFTLGIMNSDVLKAGIDILTAILTAINNITDAFGQFSGAAKIGVLVTALYLGDKALKVFMASLAKSGSVFSAFGAVGSSAVTGTTSAILRLNKGLSQASLNAAKLNQVIKKGFSAQQNTALANYNKHLVREQQLDQARYNTKQRMLAMEKAGLQNTAQYTTLQQHYNATQSVAANQTNKRIAAETALFAAMELTDNQQKEALALNAMGISMDAAATLASAGYTTAQIAEMAAARGVSEAEMAELLVKEANTKATGSAAIAQFILASANTLQQKGLKALIKSWWQQLTAKFADIKATWAQTAANYGLQASMWSVLAVTLLIAAAILILVGIVILLITAFKNAQKNTPEGKLKSAEEAADAAAEAAQRAADAYNNLTDSFESLADKYDALDELTRGTQEWRDAVKEVNDEVLSLINDYPELAALVKNENGVLTLDLESQDVQDVLNKYEKQAAAAQNASLAAKINVNEKKAVVRANEVTEDVEVYNGDYTEKMSAATTEALARAMQSGDVRDKNGDGNADEIAAWLKENGNYAESTYASAFAEQLSKTTDELMVFGNELYAMSEQERVYKEQMAQNAIGLVDATKYTEEQMKQMDVAATADFADSFTDKFEADFSNKGKDEIEDAKAKVAKNLYGEDATVSGNKITYTDENGEKQTKELTDEEFKEQWAAIQATSAMTEAFEQLPKTINKISTQMSSEAGKAFKAMYAGKEGSAMTKTDIEAAGKITQGELVTIWNNLTEEEKKAYGSFEQLQKQYNDSVEAGNEALKQAQEASINAGITLMEGITMEAARGYANQMRNVYLLNENATEDLQKELNDVINTLNETDKTSFISALNALDWQNVESLESLPETLEQMGINVPDDELEEYIELLKESAGATRKIDLEKVRDTILELTNIKEDINNGNQGRSFSEEAYNSLKEMAPELADQFQLTQDGSYTYLGSAMKDLTLAIEDNTTALLSEANKQLINKIAMADVASLIEVNVDGIVRSFGELNNMDSEEAQRNALKEFQKIMTDNNKEIMGIAGFGNYSSVDKLSGDELDNIITQIVTISNEKTKNQNLLGTAGTQSAAVLYQGNSAVQNAYGANVSGRYENMSKAGQNEFDARSSALMAQATQTGVATAIIDEYAKVVNAYKKGEAEYSKVLEVQRKLANSNDYQNMRDGLKGVFEMISDVHEEYSQLAEGDAMGKIALANQALSQFGIQIDSAATADKYMEIINQVSQGNTKALSELVAMAQESAGLAVKSYGNAYSQGWTEVSAEQIEFYDQMAAAHLGYWQMLENGERQFVWATVSEMQTIAKAASTAVEAWENPYTWLYNYNEEINRLTRDREKAERDYARLLKEESADAEDILAISQQQLANLKAQAEMHATSAGRAMDEIEAQFQANSKFSKYVNYDAGTNEILIDYSKLDAANFDEETGTEFEEFLSVLEENRDVIIEAENALYDIEDEVQEIKDRGKSETSNLYNQIKEGLVASRQKEIDELQTINDSIQSASEALVNQMQQQIEENRQARDNQKQEQSISDKETRLAYLMRDTSGGNAMEITSLQQEIAQDKEGYTDSLVDQQLQSLQDANAAAAKQRQMQIDIAQAQLDAYASSEIIWQDVQTILTDSLTQAQNSSNFSETWMATQAHNFASMASGIGEMNPIEKEELAQELTTNAKLSSVWQGIATTAEDATTLTEKADDTLGAIGAAKTAIYSVQSSVGTLGSANIDPGVTSITKGAGTNTSNIVYAITGMKTAITAAIKGSGSGGSSGTGGIGSGRTGGNSGSSVLTGNSTNSSVTGNKATVSGGSDSVPQVEATQGMDGGVPAMFSGFNDATGKLFDISIKDDQGNSFRNNYVKTGAVQSDASALDALYRATYGEPEKLSTLYKNGLLYVRGTQNWYSVVEEHPDWKGSQYRLTNIQLAAKAYRSSQQGKAFRYATGGLADYTGPAWLDGTKSKPEIVLNQADSANFMILRDILADILDGTSDLSQSDTANNKRGDNYYDIEINVDSINDDYDVEQLANKIKSMIYEDSIYRNVNMVSGIR